MSHAKNYHNNKIFSIFIATERMIHCKASQEYLYLCTWLHVDQRGWKNLQAPSLAKLDFTAESLRLYFNFQCWCWHFYVSGSGLLTEHIETSLLIFPPSFQSVIAKNIYYFLIKDAHPSLRRGALKQDEMAPAFVTVSRVTGEGQELEYNHSIEWQNTGLKEKSLD